MMFDIYAEMCLDTQWIEGVNNVVKHLLKRCPGIAWPLLNDRLKNNRTVRKLSREHLEELVEACVSVHEQTNEELSDEKNIRDKYMVQPEELAADAIEMVYERFPYSETTNPSQDQLHAAVIASALKKKLLLAPSYEDGLRFTAVNGTAVHATPTVWIPVYSYNRGIWCSAWGDDHEDEKIQLNYPVDIKPFVKIIEELHRFTKGGDDRAVMVDHVGLVFNLKCKDRASVTFSEEVCEMLTCCPCRRARKGKGKGGKGGKGRGGGRKGKAGKGRGDPAHGGA